MVRATPDHIILMKGVAVVTGLGIISILSVFAYLFYAKVKRTQTLQLVSGLLLADLGICLQFLITHYWLYEGEIAPGTLCNIQAVLLNTTAVSSSLWVLAISFHTYITIVHHKQQIPKWFATVVGIVIWSFALFISLIGLAIIPEDPGFPYYDSANAYCWISPHYAGSRIYFSWAFHLSCVFGMLILYAIIIAVLRTTSAMTRKSRANFKRAQKKLFWYPVFFTIYMLPIAMVRLGAFAGYTFPPTFVTVAICVHFSGGFCNSMLYGIIRWITPATAAARKVYQRAFKIVFGYDPYAKDPTESTSGTMTSSTMTSSTNTSSTMTSSAMISTHSDSKPVNSLTGGLEKAPSSVHNVGKPVKRVSAFARALKFFGHNQKQPEHERSTNSLTMAATAPDGDVELGYAVEYHPLALKLQ